jgi:monoamine oxidase
VNFPQADQDAFDRASEAFHERLEEAARGEQDVALSTLVDPRGRWTPLLDAVSTYISGAELDRVSARDLWNYADTGVNWRVRGGYGAMIAAHAGGVNTQLGCAVQRIDHAGKRLKIETTRGELLADRAIITLPSRLIAEEAITFSPALPAKIDAAHGLPLGLADKLYLTLPDPEAFPTDCRALGRTDSAATAAYHIRPLGKPQIECYFAGANAADLERGGEAAFLSFAREELTGLFGADFARRAGFIALHRWGVDPWAGGSYSYARPGCAGQRQVLAAPVDDRLFFAGEACSEHDYSTAHGAYRTGVAAAEAAMAAGGRISAGF